MTSESRVVWTDDRRPLVWIFFIGSVVWLVLTVSIVSAVFTIISEDDYLSFWRKYSVLGGYIFASIAAVYFSVGIFQVIFIERKNAFIAWRVSFDGAFLSIEGLFGKSDSIDLKEIESVKLHKVKTSIKNIATLMAWHTENYLISTKDGRMFFLSKDMDKDGSLSEILRGGRG
jgi:hypothetical protein